jgi:hypothetical protein
MDPAFNHSCSMVGVERGFFPRGALTPEPPVQRVHPGLLWPRNKLIANARGAFQILATHFPERI